MRDGTAILLINAIILLILGSIGPAGWTSLPGQLVVLGICPGILIVALWKMTEGDPASSWTRQRGAARWTIRAAAIAYALLTPLMYLTGGLGALAAGSSLYGLSLQPLIVGLISCFMLDYLARVARRFRWKLLHRSAAIAVWVWILATVLSIPLIRFFVVFGLRTDLRPPYRVEPLLGTPMELPVQLQRLWGALLLGIYGIRTHGVPWVAPWITIGSLVLLVLFMRQFYRAAKATAAES